MGHEENIDVGVKRTEKDVINWKRVDPILRLSKSLIKKNFFSSKEIQDMSANIINDIEKIYKSSKKNIITKQKKIKQLFLLFLLFLLVLSKQQKTRFLLPHANCGR